MKPCLKQKTRCMIVTPDGYNITGVNGCTFDEDAKECPRIPAGCKTGEGYELCSPQEHAEIAAVRGVKERGLEDRAKGGTAYLYGHYWFCGPCQEALTSIGVRSFVITGKPA